MKLANTLPLAIAISGTAAQRINFGEQIQEFSGLPNTNYNVAWADGTDPCRKNSLINYNSENPCGRSFMIDYVMYHLAWCGTDNFGLYRSLDNIRVGRCVSSSEKINCDRAGKNVHDVVKHWLCGYNV